MIKVDELNKNYNPKEIEEKIYDIWIKNNSFAANVNKNKKPFCIVMPPPNVTGRLHMGHALDISIQDSIIRYKRMKGFEALWQPGTDHAAIATEIKIIDKLKSEGKNKYDLGREGFLKEAWDWKNKYENEIINQQKKMGASCDWDKLRFTMDEGCSNAVRFAFKKLYDKNLIYKGNKIVNWCPHCKTTISDAEVNYKELEGALYHIKYYFKDDKDKYVIIATTRPETLLGDTAVCVNPKDDRYKNIIGKTLLLPLLNRELKIIADDYVDIEFGTGLVKITPCHDPNDFEVGLRHNLEQICILDDDGKIDCKQTRYHQMDREQARKEIVEDLKNQGYIEKIEKHMHNVGTHDRCNTVIEPMVKNQWFVKMKPLAELAINALKTGDLSFIPDNYKNTYLHWLYNIKDWCISRQIWWGHRIPVYYCKDCNEITVSYDDNVTKCSHCGSNNIIQDEDTLDTWFSSALWPFSTLGWPEKTENYNYFYPTNVLVTGYDIIFFWVIRMVFSGIEHTDKCPFNQVLIHGIVRDEQGRKMSKSLNNGIDPLEIIEKYGADALRLMLLTGNAPGNDMRFIIEKVEAARNFINKVWNASRFILLNIDDNFNHLNIFDYIDKLSIEDKWILTELNNAINEISNNIDNYELGIALDKINDFVWDKFCDWYIEISKTKLYSDNINEKNISLNILIYVLNNSLKLLHPFCPFVTEEIYEKINNGQLLITSEFPEYNEKLNFENDKKDFEYLQNIIKSIRNRRKELNVPNNKTISIIINTNEQHISDLVINNKKYFKQLSNVSEIIDKKINNDEIDKHIQLVFENSTIYIPMNELVNKEEEIIRIKKEIDKISFEIDRATQMLQNEKFISKAPKEKIDEEKNKLSKYNNILINLKESLEKINSL